MLRYAQHVLKVGEPGAVEVFYDMGGCQAHEGSCMLKVSGPLRHVCKSVKTKRKAPVLRQ